VEFPRQPFRGFARLRQVMRCLEVHRRVGRSPYLRAHKVANRRSRLNNSLVCQVPWVKNQRGMSTEFEWMNRR
jgi:hypothetical protein